MTKLFENITVDEKISTVSIRIWLATQLGRDSN